MAEKYEKFFDDVDVDKSGTLTWEELGKFLGKQGYTKEQVKEKFGPIDTDGDKQISRQEFLEAMGVAPPTEHKEAAMRMMFRGFDKDGNGTITGQELKELWKEDFQRVLTEEEQAKLIDRIEGAGGDDLINYEEFLAYFSNPDRLS